MNNILNDMILPTITVKKKPKKKEEKRKKKKNLGMKRAFNKLRPSLEIKQGVEDKMGRPSSPTLSYDSGFFFNKSSWCHSVSYTHLTLPPILLV